MPRVNTNRKGHFNIRRTRTNILSAESDYSPLGKKRMKIASELEQSDEPAFNEADIESELEKRRGGYVKNGQ